MLLCCHDFGLTLNFGDPESYLVDVWVDKPKIVVEKFMGSLGSLQDV